MDKIVKAVLYNNTDKVTIDNTEKIIEKTVSEFFSIFNMKYDIFCEDLESIIKIHFHYSKYIKRLEENINTSELPKVFPVISEYLSMTILKYFKEKERIKYFLYEKINALGTNHSKLSDIVSDCYEYICDLLRKWLDDNRYNQSYGYGWKSMLQQDESFSISIEETIEELLREVEKEFKYTRNEFDDSKVDKTLPSIENDKILCNELLKSTYIESLRFNLMTLLIYEMYGEKVLFTKSCAKEIYLQNDIRNAPYRKYRSSYVRRLLFGEDEVKKRETTQALALSEYIAMRISAFTQYYKPEVIDHFLHFMKYEKYNLGEINHDKRFSKEDKEKLKEIIKELKSSEENKKFQCIKDNYEFICAFLKKYLNDSPELCRIKFKLMLNQAKNAFDEIKQNTKHDSVSEDEYNMFIRIAEYVTERIYCFNTFIKTGYNENLNPERLKIAMKIQNIYFRDIIANNNMKFSELKKYVKYETEFFYPLLMYVLKYIINEYIEIVAVSKLEFIKDIYDNTFEIAYNGELKNVDNETCNNLYKELWKYYMKNESDSETFKDKISKELKNDTMKTIIDDVCCLY